MKEKLNLACPFCGEPLHNTSHTLNCKKCCVKWPIKNGIVNFITKDILNNVLKKNELMELNNRISHQNWKLTLSNHPSKLINDYLFEILNVDQTNFELLISSLKSEGVALEIGTRMGNLTRILSRKMQEVISMDPSGEWLSFVQHIFRQEEIRNVTLIRSEINIIPISLNSIDFVLINCLTNKTNLIDLKYNFYTQLGKIYRILRPGGMICLAFENETSLLKFFDINPGKTGYNKFEIIKNINFIMQKVKEKLFLYNIVKYFYEMLSNMKFQEVKVYGVFPNHRYPKFILPIDGKVISYFQRNFNDMGSHFRNNLICKFLEIVGKEIFMIPSFVVLGEKTVI